MKILHLSSLLFVLTLTGCNVYSFVDSPSGDAQLLSAARACFDQGDFPCATKYYGQLSPASSDQANAEDAFRILDENGASMGVFLKAVASQGSNGGKFVTKLAATFSSLSPGVTTRMGIFRAFQKTTLIQDPGTQGLVRFITAAAFLAEILAENSATAGTFKKSDLVSDSKACEATTGLNFTGCDKPSTNKFNTGTSIKLSTAADADINTTNPTLFMITAAVTEIQNGLIQMQATGSLGTATQTFTTQVSNNTTLITTSEAAFRKILIQQELGD